MVLCPKCGCFLPSLNSLKFHLQTVHSLHVSHGFNAFSCKDSCSRDFANWKSYRHHLVNYHKTPVTSNDETSIPCKRLKIDPSCSTNVPSTSHANLQLLNSFSDCDKNLEINSTNSCPELELSACHSTSIPSGCDTNLENNDKSSSSVPYNSAKFEGLMKSNADIFLKNMYSSKNVNRKFVQNVVVEVEELVGNNNSIARQAIQSRLSQEGVSSETQKLVNDVFNSLQHPFRSLTSDYLRLKSFRCSPLWVEPQELIIGDAEDLNTASVIPVSVKMAYISLSGSFKGCLESPGVFHSILEYMGKIMSEPSGIISNFIQTNLWKSKIKGLVGFHFPIFLFFDDFQVNGSLGPHADTGKLGGLYASLPILPPHLRSLVDNIFVVLLLKSQDRELFSNAPVFQKVIEELKDLQTNGLNITVNGISYTVYFHLGLIIGDNLGLNSMLDFVACFTANHSCRFCKIHRDALHFATVEDLRLLRNKDNYQADVAVDDPSSTGILEKSVWNTLPGFHVCENYSVDWMHDILQGCCHYDMCHIIKSLIHSGCFTLAELNFHLGSHDYGSSENKPTSIRQENLDNFKFRMSASEMLSFVRNFSVMVGHLVPVDNQVWYFYLVLRKIMDILSCPIVNDSLCVALESLVEEHHSLYFVLFKDTLKPKHHNMVHYPRIMREVGPLIHTWCMRYESKNQAAAVAAHATKSRKNTCKTLAIREQITQVTKTNVIVPSCTFGKFKYVERSSDFEDFIACFPFKGKILLTDHVIFHSVTFKVGSFVYINVGDNGQLPIFAKILHIVVQGEEFRFLVSQYRTICFNEHYHAYEISKRGCEFLSVQKSDLLQVDIFPCHFAGKCMLLSTKYVL